MKISKCHCMEYISKITRPNNYIYASDVNVVDTVERLAVVSRDSRRAWFHNLKTSRLLRCGTGEPLAIVAGVATNASTIGANFQVFRTMLADIVGRLCRRTRLPLAIIVGVTTNTGAIRTYFQIFGATLCTADVAQGHEN